MPYKKITSGKNKGKYRSERSGRIMTLKQIQAYKAKERKKGRK